MAPQDRLKGGSSDSKCLAPMYSNIVDFLYYCVFKAITLIVIGGCDRSLFRVSISVWLIMAPTYNIFPLRCTIVLSAACILYQWENLRHNLLIMANKLKYCADL